MAYEYTADVQITVSGTITFRDIPSFTYKTILRLLEGYALGSVENTLDGEQKPEEQKPEDRTTEIGRTIQRLRKIYRLSRRELAMAIRYSDTAVKLWETGENLPSTDAREALMTHFGLDTLDLDEEDFAGIEKRRAAEIAEAARAPKKRQEDGE